MNERSVTSADVGQAGLFLVCVAAPVATDTFDVAVRGWADQARLIAIAVGTAVAVGSLVVETTSALIPLKRMPIVAYLGIPLTGLLLAPVAVNAEDALRVAALHLLIGVVVIAVVGQWGLQASSTALLAALALQLIVSVPVEAFGPPNDLRLFFAADEGLFGSGKFLGVFADPNATGRAAAIAVVLWACLRSRVKGAAPLIAILAVGTLIATQSRTAWLATSLALAFLVGRRRSATPREAHKVTGRALVLAVIMVAAVVGSSSLRRVLEREGNPGELFTLTGRRQIWAASFVAWLQRPFLGYGFGNTGLVLAESRRLGHTDNSVSYAHNGLLQILLTSGAVGLALVASIGEWLKRRLDWSKVADRTLGLGVLILVLNVTESVFTSRIDWTDIMLAAVLADVGRPTSRLALA